MAEAAPLHNCTTEPPPATAPPKASCTVAGTAVWLRQWILILILDFRVPAQETIICCQRRMRSFLVAKAGPPTLAILQWLPNFRAPPAPWSSTPPPKCGWAGVMLKNALGSLVSNDNDDCCLNYDAEDAMR
ncbi:GD12838 [Drosophila simulans]|uniref:GD12838 n=1 Tax=Drosophila simulans TaxID=7240 RepID=B4QPM1_DROSI|nr:GD12838 [Drosophila simulans]